MARCDRSGTTHYPIVERYPKPRFAMTNACQDRLSADVFPPQLGGLELGPVAIQDPDRPEAGVSLGYHNADLDVRVTLYDRGLGEVPGGPKSSVIFEEANRVLADLGERVEIGMYERVHIIDQLVTDRGANETHFFAIEYQLTRDGEQHGAAFYLTGHTGMIVRISIEGTHNDPEAARHFVHSVGRLLGP